MVSSYLRSEQPLTPTAHVNAKGHNGQHVITHARRIITGYPGFNEFKQLTNQCNFQAVKFAKELLIKIKSVRMISVRPIILKKPDSDAIIIYLHVLISYRKIMMIE